MRPCGFHLVRRGLALVLAYLLALQVILTAWAAVIPAAAAAGGLTVICSTHADSAVPASDQPATCPCGPMCLSGCCATVGAVDTAATLVVFRAAPAVGLRPVVEAVCPTRVASAPEQARAPPVLA